ncbi:glycoside hydrolase family 26 protein [Streptomyces sp. NPDC096132]|uniref:glycoside hydrolase family 26 protein n=1 Tax=Streptomyces sp. NPDC096132 TaxID=3366075 RepID=UPI00381B54FA
MAPQQRRVRFRRSAVVVATAAAAVSVVLASGPGLAIASPDPVPSAMPTQTPGTLPPQGPGTPPPQGPGAGPSAPPAQTPAPASSPAAAPTADPAVPVVPASAIPAQATSDATTPEPPAPTSAPSDAPTPAFGAYLDYGARGVARIARLSEWLGGAELRVGHTYLPGDQWRNIEGPPGFLDVWADWRRQQDDRLLVLNVPMMERNEEGVSDPEVRDLLQRGAAGEFDHHFRALAERLVSLRVPDTVIVLGWEMNGTTYTHRCGPDPQSWKTYWNRIVTTMRAVPGQRFRFDFTPTRGKDAVPWTECYPGDDTVDIIGMDAYDQPSGLSFEQQVTEPLGLQEHIDFAKAHGKPVSYPEWGLFRNGDNAEYMRGMLDWMDRHKPLYNTLTDYCPHGVWQCRRNPRASEVYRSLLSDRTDDRGPLQTTPASSVSSAGFPAGTAPWLPADCWSIALGDWLESRLGGRPCLRLDRWSRGR